MALRAIRKLACLALAAAALASSAQAQSTNDLLSRALERRAVEAAIWGMPAVNYDLMRQEMLSKTPGKVGQVKLVGFDLDPVSWQMVKDGKIDALVVQDPFKMGYEGMNIVLTNLTGGKVPEFMGLGTKLLTKENADEFANDPQVTGK